MDRHAKRELVDAIVALWRDGRSVGGIVLELGRPLRLLARRHKSNPAQLVLALLKNRRRRDRTIPPALFEGGGFNPEGRRVTLAPEDQRALLPATLGNAAAAAKVTA